MPLNHAAPSGTGNSAPDTFFPINDHAPTLVRERESLAMRRECCAGAELPLMSATAVSNIEFDGRHVQDLEGYAAPSPSRLARVSHGDRSREGRDVQRPSRAVSSSAPSWRCRNSHLLLHAALRAGEGDTALFQSSRARRDASLFIALCVGIVRRERSRAYVVLVQK